MAPEPVRQGTPHGSAGAASASTGRLEYARVHSPYTTEGFEMVPVMIGTGVEPVQMYPGRKHSDASRTDSAELSEVELDLGGVEEEVQTDFCEDLHSLVGTTLKRNRTLNMAPCGHIAARRLRYRREVGVYICDRCQFKWKVKKETIIGVDTKSIPPKFRQRSGEGCSTGGTSGGQRRVSKGSSSGHSG